MPTVILTVYGADGDDGRHLQEMVSNLEYVEEVETTLEYPGLPPGQIDASISEPEIVRLVIELAKLAGKIVAQEVIKEQFKDLLKRVEKWRAAKNEESKRPRISFELVEAGELAVPRSNRKERAKPRAAVLRKPRTR